MVLAPYPSGARSCLELMFGIPKRIAIHQLLMRDLFSATIGCFSNDRQFAKFFGATPRPKTTARNGHLFEGMNSWDCLGWQHSRFAATSRVENHPHLQRIFLVKLDFHQANGLFRKILEELSSPQMKIKVGNLEIMGEA